jgi:hypothetical protein
MKAPILLSLFLTTALLVVSSNARAVQSRHGDTKGIPSLHFLLAFNEGADCPRLFELRNEAKKHGATKDAEKLMNEKLRGVGCFTDTSKRRR